MLEVQVRERDASQNGFSLQRQAGRSSERANGRKFPASRCVCRCAQPQARKVMQKEGSLRA